jgi:hypothetical protein
MTEDQKIIHAKAAPARAGQQLGNVAQACKIMVYGRDSFYRFKDRYDEGSEVALQERSWSKVPLF